MLKSYLLFFLIFCALGNSSAITYSFEHYTSTEGLSENSVNYIFRDSKGHIWIATNDGLNCFDGYQFIVFRNIPGNPGSLSHNLVFYISEDKLGNIWVGTEKALDRFNASTFEFEHFYIDFDQNSQRHFISPLLSNIRLISFYKDSLDNFWIGRNDAFALLYLDPLKRTITELKIVSEKNNFTDDRVAVIFQDNQSQLWVGTAFNGIVRYHLNTKKFTFFKQDNNKNSNLSNNDIRCIFQDNENRIWMGTYGNGLNLFNANQNSFERYINNKFKSDYVYSIQQDKNGRLLIGTDGEGLYVIDIKTGDVQNIRYESFKKESLTNNVVRTLYIDHENYLWLGNFQGGLSLSREYVRKPFHNSNPDFVFPGPLPQHIISALLVDRSGNLWIGTDGGGLIIKTPNNKYFRIENTNPQFNANAILSLLEDHNGNIWVGTFLKGIFVFNSEFKLIKKFNFDEGKPEYKFHNDIRDLCEDKNYNVWAATHGGGVYQLNLNQGVIQHYEEYHKGSTNSSNITNNWCTGIICDPQNNIWVTGFSGLSVINTSNGSINNYFQFDRNNLPKIENKLLCIYHNLNDTVWIGTTRGLNKYRYLKNQLELLKNYTVEDGLPNEQIQAIIPDNSGNIWISTFNGLSILQTSTQKFRNFDINDGLCSNNLVKGAAFKTPEGELFFGSMQGYTSFWPDEIKADTTPPIILLTQLRINNEIILPNQRYNGRKILTKNLSNTHEIKLLPNDRTLTFFFSVIHFLTPKKNKIQYKLENFDPDWITTNYNNQQVTYTNLDPGNYTFCLRAFNGDGIVTKNELRINIVVRPHYYQTWIFRIVGFLLLVLLLLAFLYFREKQLLQLSKKLQVMVTDRTLEIERKNELLSQHAENLNKSNTLLEEGKSKIQLQAEELFRQKEELFIYNHELLITNAELNLSKKEIQSKVEQLYQQKEKLESINAELKSSNATKDKFFSIIAHDLRNPFNSFIGFSELLIRNFDHWEDTKKIRILNELWQSSQNLYALLENLLTWAKSQQGNLDFNPKPIKLMDIISASLNYIGESANHKKVKINVDNTDPDTLLLVDLNMINTIFRNLLSNAVKFSREGGVINLSCIICNNHIEIHVKDNGIGIPQNFIPELFLMGKNFTREGTNKEKGTGLGLLLCKEFIDLHQGQIRVESTEGLGSDFIVILPNIL